MVLSKKTLLASLAGLVLSSFVQAAPYNETWADYNFNTNTNSSATILEYTTKRFGANSSYHPSPTNWREHPVYTIMLDKHFDGEPSNNDHFKTQFEWAPQETQLRHGGDIMGLVNDRSLDYLQALGIEVIYVAGTPFLNMPWQADGYSALDFTLIDPHWGTVQDWANAINKIHSRGMYFIVDFTIGTMGNLIAPTDHLNDSAPFNVDEYDVQWNRAPYGPWNLTEYPDFKFNNSMNYTCSFPAFYNESGYQNTSISTTSCKASVFDQYGDMEAFGVHLDWQRQLGKFAGVQDRLREWNDDVRATLEHLACMFIEAFDVDGIRIDKATQITVSASANWATATRECATKFGKKNFFINGEVTGGDTVGSLYYGRGRQAQDPANSRTFDEAIEAATNSSMVYLRESGHGGWDGSAFHYSYYRAITRLVQLDGNLEAAFDIGVDPVTAWRETVMNNDLVNSQTGEFDPRHWMAMTNHDIFRWPAMVNGTHKMAFGHHLGMLLIPGVPLVYYGEEQSLYLLDNSAANYIFGRQAMTATTAWQRHGCYKLGSTQYHNFQYGKSLFGCDDPNNSLDHYDPSAPYFRYFQRIFQLRKVYSVLMDGFQVLSHSNQTYEVQFPGSSGTVTDSRYRLLCYRNLTTADTAFLFSPFSSVGIRSQSRSALAVQANEEKFLHGLTDYVWFVWHNENVTMSYNNPCGGSDDESWIQSPYIAGVTVQNLLYPYQKYVLENSTASYDGSFRGCLRNVTLAPFGFMVLVPEDVWYPPAPSLTKFSPGHDARLLTVDGSSNETSFGISFEFDQEMNCDSLTQSLNITFHGAPGSTAKPKISGTPVCGSLKGQSPPVDLQVVPPSGWRWNATVADAEDGIYEISFNNVATYPAAVNLTTNHRFIVRKGKLDNPLVFIDEADYSSDLLSGSAGSWTLNHKAAGADLFRYSGTYGIDWSDWFAYENTTSLNDSVFDGKFWSGQHIMVQYYSNISGSAAPIVHADADYTGGQRRVPRVLARGTYNQFGYDQGLQASFKQVDDSGNWEMPLLTIFPTLMQINHFGFDDYFYGDADGDGVLDRLPPNSLTPNYLNLTAPPRNKLGWTIQVNDQTGKWTLEPRGHAWVSLIIWILVCTIPPLTAVITAVSFRKRFYAIKINKYGVAVSKIQDDNNEKAGRLAPGQKIIGWPEDPNKKRKMIIATLEYEILDWKIKVKIGGLGVMSKLMGTAMEDCDLVWLIPKVGDVEYPPGEPTEPIEVIIFGEPYLIECEIHVYKNITYYILDSPVFRAQTKSDPYPARMDDLSSAVFYSTWNQAIAETIRRNPVIDIYHINDYHGTLAPLYLLPKVFPVCLSLHNAEFQGLWPLRSKDEMNEVCAAFNLPKEVTTKYIQYGNTFNLLHAGASFIAHHQNSIGVAGVSDKYGKRSWARYPALWILKHIDSLPNPDPDDVEALSEQVIDVKNIGVDQAAEAKRPSLKRQAQEWAGIETNPNAQLFVFVGRWSKQKGVDIIADVFPALLEKRKDIQLIAVGPVIDLYGRFAAEKLARLMEMYPKQVFSKPEFTSLPAYLFSGADFALIPSRDEPFGLVAVEFGRKGALGVGARLGGLGLMPGWWFPVESTSTSHMISQLQKTIKLALKSSEQERAVLRARSAVQRFPVLEWRQRTEILQKRSIRASRKGAGSHAYDYSEYVPPQQVVHGDRHYGDLTRIERVDWSNRTPMDESQTAYAEGSIRNAPVIADPMDPSRDNEGGFNARRYGDEGNTYSPASSDHSDGPYFSDEGSPVQHQNQSEDLAGDRSSSYGAFLASANRQIAKQTGSTRDPFFSNASRISFADDGELQAPNRPFTMHSRNSSISSIVDEHGSSSPLNKAMETFTDEKGLVANEFVQKLKNLNSDNSKGDLCIEKYLEKAEKAHFVELRREKIDSSKASGYGSSLHENSVYTAAGELDDNLMPDIPMSRMQIFMGRQIGEWPLYSIVMSVGQLLSATAFQLVLLSGSATQTDLDLYVIGAVFFTASICWWAVFRTMPSVYGLSFPWIFFSIAFFMIGLPSFHGSITSKQTYIQAAATWCYASASAANFMFFGMNFGEEAGATTESWVFRACVIQGLQQCWTAALWWWGSLLVNNDPTKYIAPRAVLYVVWPLALISMVFFVTTWWGLPQYYLQKPPTVPNFYATLFRRHIVQWFLVAEILRDFWLAPPTGRSWKFLWNNTNVPEWATVIMIGIFFIGIWSILLYTLTRYAKVHSWLLPVFAIGLGAPRWCQMFWAISGIGANVPWAGSVGPYLSTGTWLWLGVLDAIQGVGLGMALLQTLSRFHVNAALFFCQCLGALVVIVARIGSPDRLGPYTVFPNIGLWDKAIDGLTGLPVIYPLFWICLACQIGIVVGYLWLFRKEQLTKP
ncbi:alpha--glucan synthase [Phaffia rhodozyma]|uniref:alpha-1,3-glucan synthase n=1 Tax=Phaffia rhodozyma TaxID=264483 RepID=A0A0F7SRN7_PHARH|nr:alpha--glucan synthase [Phaffia rhodozyma]